MTTVARRDKAIEFLQLVAAGRIAEAYDRHISPGFRHHNPYFRGNAASLRKGMEENAALNPNKTLKIQHALEDRDLVAIFSHIRQKPDDRGAAVVHLFRFDGNRIAELWDIGQPVPEDSLNEHGMF